MVLCHPIYHASEKCVAKCLTRFQNACANVVHIHPTNPAAKESVSDEINTNNNDRPDNTRQTEEISLTSMQLDEYMSNNPDATVRRLGGRPTTVQTGGRPAKAHRYIISYINPNKEVIEALDGIEGSDWKKAISDENDALIKNGTWTLVERPKDASIIKTRWLLTKKPDGQSTRFKARLVAKGYNQQYRVDFDETYAPVLRSSSIKVLLSYAINNCDTANDTREESPVLVGT